MNRAVLDPRVLLPVLLGSAVLAGRELLRPGVPPAPPPAISVELPTPQLVPPTNREIAYDLDLERSTVRFVLRGEGRDLVLRCPVVSGSLEFRPPPAESVLELHLDLGTLAAWNAPVDAETDACLDDLLGARRDGRIDYRGTLVSTATSPLQGLVHRLFSGAVCFGSRVVRQPVGLWQTALPGQPLRLQGYGTVDAATFRRPRPHWFGLAEEHHAVTLGLDLAWKRRTG